MREAMGAGTMDAYDWFGAALAVGLWAFTFWLVAWSPRRVWRLARGLLGWLVERVTDEPNEFQGDLDEAMAVANRQAEKAYEARRRWLKR